MIIKEFWKLVNKNGPIPKECPELGPCWIWLGGCFDSGYGRARINGKHQYAHIISYKESRKQIPEGYHLHHKCVNRWCVNDNHLEPVTPKSHPDTGGALNAQKTHCPKGHLYDLIDSRGHRRCRSCVNSNKRRRRFEIRVSGKIPS